MIDDFINGVDAIVAFSKENFGPTSWDTLKYWEKEYKFPIRRYPTNRPYLVPSEAKKWAIEYDNLRRKRINPAK